LYVRQNGNIVATMPLNTLANIFRFNDIVINVVVGDQFSFYVQNVSGSGIEIWHILWTFLSTEV